MVKRQKTAVPFQKEGLRLKQLREVKGLSQRELAKEVGVDATSVGGWEKGKRLPRAKLRPLISRKLGVDLESLFSGESDEQITPVAVRSVDTITELPRLLVDLGRQTRRRIRALRLASPYPTTANVQVAWRKLARERLREGAIDIERIEIFYDLRRLQEVLSNIFRYENCRYYVKSYCLGVNEVVPGLGGYFFDDREFVLGGYWQNIPPIEEHQRGLRVSGTPFRHFFNDYWSDIWRRGTWLNARGPHDLAAVKKVAEALGLPNDRWPSFVAEAKALTIGDGAPPLI
jgi:transcriptional regulator with XRE-family HTH domain